VVPRLSKAEVVERDGLEALTSKLAAAGFALRPELTRAVSVGGLENLLFLSDRTTLFGQGGVEVAAAVEPGRGRKVWAVRVNVVLYSARADEVLTKALERERMRAAYVLVNLMELLLGQWRTTYRAEFSDPSEVDEWTTQIVTDVDTHAEAWFSRFDDVATGEEFVFHNRTKNFEPNHDAGLVAALERGDIASAKRFSATLGSNWKPAIGPETVERRTSLYRRIGAQYGVDLPLVTWDEVRARG